MACYGDSFTFLLFRVEKFQKMLQYFRWSLINHVKVVIMWPVNTLYSVECVLCWYNFTQVHKSTTMKVWYICFISVSYKQQCILCYLFWDKYLLLKMQTYTQNVRFEVFTAVTMRNGVFWDVMFDLKWNSVYVQHRKAIKMKHFYTVSINNAYME
jgi:hypothetical protein